MTDYLIEFSVPFVQGKGRPRFTKGGRAYTPKATKDAEKAIAIAYEGASIRKYGRVMCAPEGVPVKVEMRFRKQAPKSWPKSVPKWLKPNLPFVQKIDVDNGVKCGLDGLNKVAYVDDAQVTAIVAVKEDRHDETSTNISVSWSVPEETEDD